MATRANRSNLGHHKPFLARRRLEQYENASPGTRPGGGHPFARTKEQRRGLAPPAVHGRPGHGQAVGGPVGDFQEGRGPHLRNAQGKDFGAALVEGARQSGTDEAPGPAPLGEQPDHARAATAPADEGLAGEVADRAEGSEAAGPPRGSVGERALARHCPPRAKVSCAGQHVGAVMLVDQRQRLAAGAGGQGGGTGRQRSGDEPVRPRTGPVVGGDERCEAKTDRRPDPHDHRPVPSRSQDQAAIGGSSRRFDLVGP